MSCVFYAALKDSLNPFVPDVLTRIVLGYCDVVSVFNTDAKNNELLPALSGRYTTLSASHYANATVVRTAVVPELGINVYCSA